ncbi:MAG: glycosyltransferase family 39 protein [Rhodospirillales bacterium]|nr:glycosyltransferase family 39 protein [Rhodospirillales bacterium]
MRLAFAAATGLGVDESYMVAAARVPAWGYFDHPPLSWWLVTGAVRLAGSEARLVVRAPFILLFAVSTWLMARVTHDLASGTEEARRWAGVRAALWLNLAPIFGVAMGSWVLPDGPLITALLGAGVLFLRALDSGRLVWWLAAGAALGLAADAKYSALLPAVGVLFYLATFSGGRRWLRRPHPWLAAVVALAVFGPVLWWNAHHQWASLAFQGGRADGHRFNPAGPVLLLASGAALLLPWSWWWIIRRLAPAWRDQRRRLCVAIATPSVLLFALVALFSLGVLVHWPAPGYLFLIPLLGLMPPPREAIWLRRSAILLGALLVGWVVIVHSGAIWSERTRLQVADWHGLRQQLAARGLLNRRNTIMAGINWAETGKVARALGPRTRTLCFNVDCREFAFWPDALRPGTRNNFGRDVLLIAPRMGMGAVLASYGDLFRRFTILGPVAVEAAGRRNIVPLYLGHDLRKWP